VLREYTKSEFVKPGDRLEKGAINLVHGNDPEARTVVDGSPVLVDGTRMAHATGAAIRETALRASDVNAVLAHALTAAAFLAGYAYGRQPNSGSREPESG
jgi:hypothetical protein